MLFALGAASFTVGLLTAVAAKIPQLDPSKQHTQANTYVYASNNHTVLAILRGSQARIVVPSERISPWMKHAIVAIEDKRFYEHRGVDVRGMARALWADITSQGTVQGGSTITQQFVKNAYLTSQKTIGRKLIEAALAWQLEQNWTKDQILTAYLNTIYFGNGAYGVEQASRIYFHHSAAADEAGRGRAARRHPGGPEPLRPGRAPAGARRRGATSCSGSSTLQGYLDEEPVRELARLPDAGSDERRACRRRRATRRRTSRTTSRTSSSTSSARRRPSAAA